MKWFDHASQILWAESKNWKCASKKLCIVSFPASFILHYKNRGGSVVYLLYTTKRKVGELTELTWFIVTNTDISGGTFYPCYRTLSLSVPYTITKLVSNCVTFVYNVSVLVKSVGLIAQSTKQIFCLHTLKVACLGHCKSAIAIFYMRS